MNRSKSIISIAIIVVVCFGVTFMIFSTEPTAEIEGATKKSAMLVETINPELGDFRPIIKASGTVSPSQDIDLSSQVFGEVIFVSEAFMPGNMVRRGDILVKIDPIDFENVLQLRKTELETAQAQLELELGRQEAAAYDYKQSSQSISVENEALLLRKPQLRIAKANVKAAEAQVEQAALNLRRTVIRAPFDAQIISRNANIGFQVDNGDVLGRLVGVKEFWVTLNVPASKIEWLDLNGSGSNAAEVILRNSAWKSTQYRTGKLSRLIGTLSNQTRFAQVLVTVKNPTISQNPEEPYLLIGSFLEASIPARKLEGIVRLDRDFLRKDQTVWLMDDQNKLEVKKVDIGFQDENFAYIQHGLSADSHVITTSLSTVVEGADLRLSNEAEYE